jgi:hypothetical protein
MTRGFAILGSAMAGAVALACNGQVDVGELPGGGTGASSGASSSGTGSSGSGAATCTSPPANGDTSCYASCCTPAGTIEPFTTVDRVYAWVLGKWQFCSGLDNWHGLGAPADAIGIEFGPGSSQAAANGITTMGGDMYYLVQGPSGPVRGAGFAYQWTYDVSAESSGQAYQFNMHPAPNGGWGTTLKYSPCPTELDITSLGYNNGGNLVALR